MTQTLRAAMYTRVSTEEQVNEGFSLRDQKESIDAYAERHGLTIVSEYTDAGKSGKSIDGRPQMIRLLEDARRKKFDVVIVTRLDRLGRNTGDSIKISELFDKNNVKLISLSESIDTTTPTGKAFFNFLSTMNQLERDTIAARVKSGMTQRAREGKWNGGICFGYEVSNKKLEVNTEEARIVEEIFDYADQGFGYKKIAGILNRKGYTTKRGHAFSIGTLKGILDNPIYIGKIRFNQHVDWANRRRAGKNPDVLIVDGEHEPIISDDLWKRVQHKRSTRSFKAVQSLQPYILTKLIRCPQCGAGMVAGKATSAKKTYRYYKCGTFHNKGSSECSSNTINADLAEQQVFEEFKRIVTDTHFLQRLVQKMNSEREHSTEPLLKEKRSLTAAFNKSEKYIANLTEKLMKDPELLPLFEEKLKEQQASKQALQLQLENLEEELATTTNEPIDLMAFHYLVKNIDTIIEKADSNEKKDLLRMIIKEIEITPTAPVPRKGRQIAKIQLHFDFTPIGVKKKSKDLIRILGTSVFDQPVDLSALDKQNPTDKEIRDTLESLSILPSLMIRFTFHYPKTTINLLQQDQLH